MEKNAPTPPVDPKFKPKGQQAVAWHKYMLENWRTCRSMFWDFPPTHRVNFCVDDKKEMLSRLTREELDLLLVNLDKQPNVKKLSTFLRMPYDFVAWFKKNIRNDEFRDLRANRKLMTVTERMERIAEAMVTEIEDRMANITHRASLETDNLVSMVKQVTATQKAMEEVEEEGETTITVVSHMPEKDEKKPKQKERESPIKGDVGLYTH